MNKIEIFNTIVGCLVANDIALDYNQYASVAFSVSGDDLLSAKCNAVDNAITDLMKEFKFKYHKANPEIIKAIDSSRTLISELIKLSPEEQEKILKTIKTW